MYKKSISFLLVIIFMFMLWYGNINFHQSLTALKLWFESLVPSMFCIMVLVKLMFMTGSLDLLAKVFTLFCEPLFHISKNSFSYVIALMFLGFPAGAAFINEAVKAGNLTKAEAQRLISTCSFATPGFVIMTVGNLLFHDIQIGIILFLIQWLSGLLLLVFTRSQPINSNRNFHQETHVFPMIATTMIESGKALYMMGGYLMLCMSITGVLLPFLPKIIQNPLSILAEFSSGIMTLVALPCSLIMRLVLVSMLLSFSGFCVHMQVMCMSDQVAMPYHKYLLMRILQALLSGSISYGLFTLLL